MADSINETNGIASAVPGEQKIREADAQTEDNVVATKDDFTLSPVITVTKKEASFSKGELKLQKVTVTEDISDDASMAEDVNAKSMDTIHSEHPKTTGATDAVNIINSETGEEVKKVSKIPRIRFRAAVNKIRREQKSGDNVQRKEMVTSVNRRSSIPRLKGNKTPPPKEETEKKRESINFDDLISNVTEADFDKIYEEIIEKPDVQDECKSTLENKDPTIVETKFDEIILAYDANKIEPLKIVKPRSKIPLLKRRSEHDIEVKEVRKELQRKGSLGRIPISDSFGDKTSSLPKVKIPQSNNRGNSLSKQDKEATLPNHITNNDSGTGNNNNVTHPTVTVTKIPLSQYNKFSKISSIVLNKQLIRINSTENNKLKQTDEQKRNGGNEDKIADAGFILPKLETKSVLEAVISEKSPLLPNLEDSIDLKATTVTKKNLNEEDICKTDIEIKDTAIYDDKTKKINISSESVFYNNAEKLNEETNIEPSQRGNTYYNHDFNRISYETPTTDLKSSEPEIVHVKEMEMNNNDITIFSKDYLTKEMKIPPKINESEVFIKYKPNVREDEVTNEHSYTNNNYNTNTNVDYKNKSLTPNESLTSKPVKYKTITASQTVEETNEEDIIILKGKVNRVISRLDSIEPKQKKKPLDDLPKQSVQSKISLFECNDPKPAVIKTVPSKSNLIHQKGDKPRVIEGILKESNKVDDFKEIDKRKIFANLENNLSNDKVKIAYGFQDELTRWENNNSNDSPSCKNIDDEYSSEKNNANESATNVLSRHNNEEMNKKENFATEDDVFAKKSAEIINSYKLSQQKKNINIESDMKRAKSLAELDLGDAVTGKVKKIIYRMKSVDKIEHRKEIINSRERPRKGSVSERIALFEVSAVSFKNEIECRYKLQQRNGRVRELYLKSLAD